VSGYDLPQLQRELMGLQDRTAPHNTAKGRRLQDLMAFLLEPVESVNIVDMNVLNNARSEETDLWCQHNAHESGLPFRDFLFPVECKNEATPISAAEVREFAAKVRHSGGWDGLMVGTAGLSGTDGKAAHDAVTRALSEGTRITVLVGADLGFLNGPGDLVALIVKRHTELRTQQGYLTI
jgi:hypothetical protein